MRAQCRPDRLPEIRHESYGRVVDPEGHGKAVTSRVGRAVARDARTETGANVGVQSHDWDIDRG